MNNIDILEKMKIVNGKIENVTPTDAIFAISNLIAENKELKEENKCLKNKELDYMTVYLTGTYDERDKWKSKVEEIIHNNKPHIAQEKLQSLLGKE